MTRAFNKTDRAVCILGFWNGIFGVIALIQLSQSEGEALGIFLAAIFGASSGVAGTLWAILNQRPRQ
jgi:hypothetical protein